MKRKIYFFPLQSQLNGILKKFLNNSLKKVFIYLIGFENHFIFISRFIHTVFRCKYTTRFSKNVKSAHFFLILVGDLKFYNHMPLIPATLFETDYSFFKER